MEEQEKVILLDEDGNEVEARIINVVEIEGQEYLLYSVPVNDEDENVFVNKIIKNANGEDEFVAIDNEEEKIYVFGILKEMINNLD